MSDRWVVAMAGCASLGALQPTRLPLAIAVVVAVAAFVVRSPALLCVGVLALTSVLAQRALAGLDGVVATPVAAEITLLTDPAPSFGGVRADARLHRRRVELRADGVSAVALRERLAGERITVRGDLQPVGEGAPWLAARHVGGRLRVLAVEAWRPGGLPSQGANQIRRVLQRGAEPLSPTARSLYTGLVIGDDRAQPAALADDFMGAGLTHLLAVSGQNVAFVLAVVGPLLRRLRLWSRLGVTLAVIAMFALVTRFEPSVLRASVMAGTAATLLTIAAPATRLRVIALAATLLVVVDPLLVRSVGFQLSLAATVAIVLVAPRLAEALPGPASLRDAASVTLAAQLGVAPVLLVVFGPLPVASFPANLLAVPVAGAVMVWGLTAGLAAGLVGGWVAEVVHVPTHLLLLWVSEVARRAAALPLGELGWWHATALGGAAALATWARRPDRSRPRALRAAAGLAMLAVGAATLTAQAPPPLRSHLHVGIVRWHAGSTDVVVLGGVGGRAQLGEVSTLAALRRAGVAGISVLVVADASVSDELVDAIRHRHPVGTAIRHGEVARAESFAVGTLEVRVTPTADRLVVEAR